MSLISLKSKSGWVSLCGGFLALLALTPALSQSLLPKLPPAKAGATQCVEPTDVMRKKHYSYILHQRDDTVHRGIRTSKYSLNECISCHVQPRKDGTYPKHTESDHFCNTCHEFAAVSVDCFQCHVDKIVPNKAMAEHPIVGEVSK